MLKQRMEREKESEHKRYKQRDRERYNNKESKEENGKEIKEGRSKQQMGLYYKVVKRTMELKIRNCKCTVVSKEIV